MLGKGNSNIAIPRASSPLCGGGGLHKICWNGTGFLNLRTQLGLLAEGCEGVVVGLLVLDLGEGLVGWGCCQSFIVLSFCSCYESNIPVLRDLIVLSAQYVYDVDYCFKSMIISV
jgi:hypothetical protein